MFQDVNSPTTVNSIISCVLCVGKNHERRVLFSNPIPILHSYCPFHLLLLLLGNCAEEVQPGQLLHPVDGNHESPQVSVAPFIRQHEADHLLGRGGIVDHFVIIFRHGDLVRADGDRLFGRENRTGHDHDPFFLRGEVPHLFFQLAPNTPVKLRSLWRHIAHEETLRHRLDRERHVRGRGQVAAIISAPGVVLRGSRPGGDGRGRPEVIAALRRPPRDLLGSHDILDPRRLFVFFYVAEGVSFTLDDRVGRAGDPVAQVVELRLPDGVGYRLAGRNDDRFGWREAAPLRLGRGDLGFRDGLDGGGGRFARMQDLVDSFLDGGLLINEPEPDE